MNLVRCNKCQEEVLEAVPHWRPILWPSTLEPVPINLSSRQIKLLFGQGHLCEKCATEMASLMRIDLPAQEVRP